MGQGIYTVIAMILAEELDADWTRWCSNTRRPTTSSTPIRSSACRSPATPTPSVLSGCRCARLAPGLAPCWFRRPRDTWNTDAAGCRTERGEVIHEQRKEAGLWRVDRSGASSLTPPEDPPLKAVNDFRLIGKPLKRLDTPEKVNGKVLYSMDVMLPGMKFATLAICPEFGGRVDRVDDRKAKDIPGVRQVVVLDDFVAVVGDHMWAAKRGVDALDIVWKSGPHAACRHQRGVEAAARRERTAKGPLQNRSATSPNALAQGERIEADYELPFLAHATMEPLNCTVHVKARQLRGLGRLAGAGACSERRREGDGPAARESDGTQPHHRRRIRTPARDGLRRESRAHRAEGRWARSRSSARASRT